MGGQAKYDICKYSWNAFVKMWRKIGNAYSNNNVPPVGMPGCEGFVRGDAHQPIPPVVPVERAAQPPLDVHAIVASCSSKSRYGSALQADAVAGRCAAVRGVILRSYQCELCGGFHLTKQGVRQGIKPGWREPRISARQLNGEKKRRRRLA